MNFESQAFPSSQPSGSLASPQSLFRFSPEEKLFQRENLREGYFPPTRADESSASVADNVDATEKRKPVLLLVEDNEINLRVCLD